MYWIAAPSTAGSGSGMYCAMYPCRTIKSNGFTADASILTRTSPAPGSGVGMSSITNWSTSP
jgi:hypothetical protein